MPRRIQLTSVPGLQLADPSAAAVILAAQL